MTINPDKIIKLIILWDNITSPMGNFIAFPSIHTKNYKIDDLHNKKNLYQYVKEFI